MTLQETEIYNAIKQVAGMMSKMPPAYATEHMDFRYHMDSALRIVAARQVIMADIKAITDKLAKEN